MIRINLLPQKRAKLRAAADPSQKQLLLGVAAIVAAAALVFVLVDMPKRQKLAKLREDNQKLQVMIRDKNKQLEGYDEMLKAKTEDAARAEAINRLIQAKVVPAHVLHELGRILTTKQQPTMTAEMRDKVTKSDAEGGDPNKRFQLDWDPTHVWLSSFVDTGGVFKLEGGAQSESDVTQLSKRLAASVFFEDVSTASGERVTDRETGLNYYKFTLTGKVAY